MPSFRPVLLLAALPLLTACDSGPSPGPYLAFIAEGQLQTASRVVGPGDTLTTRVYAQRSDSGTTQLERFTIKVQTSYYAGGDAGRVNDSVRTYLDTLIRGRRSFLFTNRFKASPLSARETWTYSVTDTEGQTSSRNYVLATRQPDSIRTWRSYRIQLQPPVRRTSRAAWSTTRGMVLPPHATDDPEYQKLVDLLYLTSDGVPTLASPTAPAAQTAPNLKVSSWTTRRATGLQLTTLTPTAFEQLNADVAIRDAVTGAGALVSSLRVQRNQVIAFRTLDNNSGLILVRELTNTAPVELVLDVKVNR